MQESHLATSGGDLKIWDSGSFHQLHGFSVDQPGVQAGSILSNSWSCDTSAVASIIKGKDRVVLSYYRHAKYLSNEIDLVGIQSPSYLQFPRTSQSHLLISAKSDLFFYDIGKKKLRKTFSLKSNVTCFASNQTDSYVAVGCANGSIAFLTVASNQVSVPLTAPRCAGQKVTGLRYSLVRPAFLGTCCESGTVSFWDCNANKNLFNMSEHIAPCTSFTFSPVNDSLAASCGLDKRLLCLDTKTKKSVFSLQLDNPCTAVDFDQDGLTLAVGTTRGKVVVYDMRNTTKYLKNLQAHNSKVDSLVFKHRIDKANISVMMSSMKTTSKSKLRSQKSISGLKTVQEESKENVVPAAAAAGGGGGVEELVSSPCPSDTSVFSNIDARRESMSSQIFSPLRETDISFPSDNTPQLPGSGVTPSGSRRVSEVRLSSEGIFSPVKDGLGSHNSSLNLGRKTPYTTTPGMSPLAAIQEETTTSTSSTISRDIPSPTRSIVMSNQELIQSSLSTASSMRALAGTLSNAARFDHPKLSFDELSGDNLLSLPDISDNSNSRPAVISSSSRPAVISSSSNINKPYYTPSSSIPTTSNNTDRDGEKATSAILNTQKLSLDTLESFVKRHCSSEGDSSPEYIDSRQVAGQPAMERIVPAQLNNHRHNSHSSSSRLDISPPQQQQQQPLSTAVPLKVTDPLMGSVGSGADPLMGSVGSGADLPAMLTAFPGVMLLAGGNSSTASPHRNSVSEEITTSINNGSTETNNVQQFGKNYVQGLVREALEDWCGGVERRLSSMHYGLIRQLHLHQEETQRLLAEVAGLTHLREENDRLRQENQQLKKIFGNFPPSV